MIYYKFLFAWPYSIEWFVWYHLQPYILYATTVGRLHILALCSVYTIRLFGLGCIGTLIFTFVFSCRGNLVSLLPN